MTLTIISRTRVLMPLVLLTLSACSGAKDETVFTLYRSSVLNENMRIHVASFDARDGRDYNAENCEQARQLFQAQDGVTTRFWCELGRYRK
jgi:hypothetical protein